MNTTVNQNTKPAINQTEENVSIKSLNEQKALLVTKISDNPTQEDFNNLTKISATIKKLFENRQNVINEIKTKITNQEFTITDIFTVEELKAGGYIPFVAPVVATATPKPRVAKIYPSDSNDVLINIPVEEGEFHTTKPLEYKKGRINEDYDEKVKTAWNVSTLPAKFAKNSNEASLKKFFTEKGKTYFATEEGKAELAKLVALLTKLAPGKLQAIKDAKEKADAKKATTA